MLFFFIDRLRDVLVSDQSLKNRTGGAQGSPFLILEKSVIGGPPTAGDRDCSTVVLEEKSLFVKFGKG